MFGLPDIVWYLVNLGVIFVALRFLVYKPVTNFLKKREDNIARLLGEAKEERDKAAQAHEGYEKRMEQTRAETAVILAEASKSAATRADDIIAQAIAEANEIKKRAERDIENEKQHAQRALKSEITDMALSIAQKIIRRELSLEDNRRLIEEFFKEVG